MAKSTPEPELYYTPSMEEFHVGFEYEIFEDWDTNPKKEWHPQTYGKNGADGDHIGYVHNANMKHIRVKFLDHADIESFGWEFLTVTENVPYFVLDPYKLHWYEPGGRLSIDGFRLLQVFRGLIKNKSELSRLMQQLNITGK